jgi:hypothetical protein
MVGNATAMVHQVDRSYLGQAVSPEAEVGAGAGDIAQGIAPRQHHLPELWVDGIEQVCCRGDVFEGLGCQAQAGGVVPHDLQHLHQR